MTTAESRCAITLQHPTPRLDTLTLGNGDGVIHNPDDEDRWLQADESHVLTLDGRWR